MRLFPSEDSARRYRGIIQDNAEVCPATNYIVGVLYDKNVKLSKIGRVHNIISKPKLNHSKSSPNFDKLEKREFKLDSVNFAAQSTTDFFKPGQQKFRQTVSDFRGGAKNNNISFSEDLNISKNLRISPKSANYSKEREKSEKNNHKKSFTEVLRIFLTKFWWWEPILWNFANFGPYRLQNFGKGLVTFVTSCWDKFWKILNFEFCQNRQVMINHRGGILIFCQIFDFGENR